MSPQRQSELCLIRFWPWSWEERHGRWTAGKSTHIQFYRHSGKLALAPMHLRRARVVGRIFAAGAQPLTHVCTVGACGKNTRRGPPALMLGAGVLRRAWGDGAQCPSGRHGAKYRGLKHHLCGLQIVQQNFKFLWARLFQKRGSMPPPPVTDHQSPEPTILRPAQQRFLQDPPVV
jgi:hypothetical protein